MNPEPYADTDADSGADMCGRTVAPRPFDDAVRAEVDRLYPSLRSKWRVYWTGGSALERAVREASVEADRTATLPTREAARPLTDPDPAA